MFITYRFEVQLIQNQIWDIVPIERRKSKGFPHFLESMGSQKSRINSLQQQAF